MLSFAPWQVGLFAVYAIAITSIACYLLIAGDPARQPKAPPIGRAPEFDHDGDIIAVAELGLAERPELADDTEAVARTVGVTDALTDTFTRTESAGWGTADAGQTWTVTAGTTDFTPAGSTLARIEVERLLIEIDRCVECYRHGQDITKDAPKERP